MPQAYTLTPNVFAFPVEISIVDVVTDGIAISPLTLLALTVIVGRAITVKSVEENSLPAGLVLNSDSGVLIHSVL